MKIIDSIFRGLHNSRISTKIMIIYVAAFAALLFATNFLAWAAMTYGMYNQAEHSLEFSMENTQKLLEDLEQNINLNTDSIRDPLTPGVVLRVVDEDGNVFLDTDQRYISLERFNENLLSNPPFWSNEDMAVAEYGHALIYRSQMQFTHGNTTMNLYFFRTIISDVTLFDRLRNILLAIALTGLSLAAASGYVVSKRILKPISDMTKTAHNIAIENMDSRIETPPVEDELTELAKTFNSMLDRLQAGIAQQQRFVSDASHELRTPATVIRGYSDLLARWGARDPEILKEGIEAINAESENMQQLIEQLLFLARADQRRQPLKMQMLELSKLVGDVVTSLEVVTHHHTLELVKNDSGTIFADKVTIRQMLRIFIDNAIKYTPKGGRITVRSERAVDKIKLSVSDTGIGIAPENQKKVFDRFFRVDTSHSKREISGTGLGLSIASWIAEQHNITIDLESELGKGTTITVSIPLQPDVDEFIDEPESAPTNFFAGGDDKDDRHDLRFSS